MKEIEQERFAHAQAYYKYEKMLNKAKEKLYKQDISKWELSPEV